MRLVMTLLARDEADIIDAHIRFHLAAGVDFLVATDHASKDGTREILEGYAAQGVLHVLQESGSEYRQSEWVTRMARIAAVEHGADWVINSDADEFWWPAGGDLKDVLSRVSPLVGIVQTFVRPFLPPASGGLFAERMTVRLAPSAPINDPASSFKVNTRLVHRAAPDVVVGRGNASLRASSLAPVTGRCPIEVLHFPIRSFEHYRRKFLDHYATVGGSRGDHVRVFEAHRAGTLDALYRRISVTDSDLRRGLACGVLVQDTRLRDALRRLASALPLEFPQWTAEHAVGYAIDLNALHAGELARLYRRVDEVDQRMAAVEARGRTRGAAA